jgi:hypothetical protein
MPMCGTCCSQACQISRAQSLLTGMGQAQLLATAAVLVMPECSNTCIVCLDCHGMLVAKALACDCFQTCCQAELQWV